MDVFIGVIVIGLAAFCFINIKKHGGLSRWMGSFKPKQPNLVNMQSAPSIEIGNTISDDEIIKLHYYYSEQIEHTYYHREDEKMLLKCMEFCIKDIELYPKFREAYLNRRKGQDMRYPYYNEESRLDAEIGNIEKIAQMDADGTIDIRIPSFQRLAMIHEKLGDFPNAIKVCRSALVHNLTDSTKGGFQGRIEKLERKANAAKPKSKNSKKPLESESQEQLYARINEIDALLATEKLKSKRNRLEKELEKIQQKLVGLDFGEVRNG